MPSTILDAAGIEVPAHYRGDSVLKLVKGEKENWKDMVYAQISEAQTARTIRTLKYKYAVRAPHFDITEPYSEVYWEDKLYDLEKDPHERNNVVSDPAYEEVRKEMRERMYISMAKANEPRCSILNYEGKEPNQ